MACVFLIKMFATPFNTFWSKFAFECSFFFFIFVFSLSFIFLLISPTKQWHEVTMPSLSLRARLSQMLWTSALASSTILFLITLKPELISSPCVQCSRPIHMEKIHKFCYSCCAGSCWIRFPINPGFSVHIPYYVLSFRISPLSSRCTIRKSLKLELRLRKPPKENWLEQVNYSVFYFLINSFRRVFMGLLCDPLIMHPSPSLSLAYHYIVSHTSMVRRQGMLFAKSNCQCASMQMENLVYEMQNKRVSARVHIRNRCELMPYIRRDN